MTRICILILSLLLCPTVRGICGADLNTIYKRYKDTESETLQHLGRACIERQHTDSAIAIFTILANRYDNSAESTDLKYAIEARLSLGVLNFLNANYPAAYSNFLTATELEGRPDSPGHLNMAAIYLYFGDRRRAYRCLKDVFDASIASGNHYMASNAVINILSADIDSMFAPQDSIALILKTFRKAVPATRENRVWPLANHLTRAKQYSIEGNPIQAIKELKKAIPEASSVLLPARNHHTISIALGRNFLKTGQTDSAEYYIRKAIDIAQNNGFPELLISGYADMSKFYEAIGKQELATEYKYKHLQLHDSIFNAREFGHIHDLELFHETDKFEKRINILMIEEKMRTRILIIVCIAVAVLSMLLALLYRQNRKLKSKNKSLFDKNIEILQAEKEPISQPRAQKKYNTSSMTDDTRRNITARIKEVMSDESVFCKEGFSLSDLAEKCSSNQKYVSQVLNEDFGKSFTQLLNERRISVAKRRFLDSKHYGHLTIEAIVHELGFKSRSTFSKTFKKITGLSPSEFQRLATDKVRSDIHLEAPDETTDGHV